MVRGISDLRNDDAAASAGGPQSSVSGMGARVKQYLLETPTGVRACCAALLAFFVVGLLLPSPSESYLAVNVVYISAPHYRLWTTLTHVLYEPSPLSLLMDLALLVTLGRFVERHLGAALFLRFCFATVLLSSLVLLHVLFLCYLCDLIPESDKLFVSGFSPVLTGLVVALKQHSPEVQVLPTILPSLRVRHLPLIAVVAALAAWLVLGSVATFAQALGGTLGAWAFLRFLETRPDGTVGDSSEQLRLASFFPGPAQRHVDRILQALASVGQGRFGMSGGGAGRDLEQGRRERVLEEGGGDRERRRNLALRAVTQRLNSEDAPSTSEGEIGMEAEQKGAPAPV